ncbi:hypothetical protein [Grimontia sp. AD028]|uniref:hypothetical protein n=1 Tax=Grimontia sp. AD028 TaxID=1581149 RepID=UPI000698DEAA|nr:hypothetical protein [Grimontia sp. AD028]
MTRFYGEWVQWIEKDLAMFGNILSSAFNFAYSYKGLLFRVTLIPILLTAALEVAAFSSDSEWMVWVDYFLWSVLSTILAVNVHRVVLMGPDSVPTFGRFTFGKIEIWFWLHYMGLGVAYLLMAFAMNWIGSLFIFLLIISLVFGCRLSLVFPAIAMGKGVSFPYAWAQTVQKTWLMIGVVVIAPFIFGIVFIPITALIAYTAPENSPLYAILATNLMISYVTVLAVIALSFAYQDITGEDPSMPSPEEPREE